jgi:hypothetical protein
MANAIGCEIYIQLNNDFLKIKTLQEIEGFFFKILKLKKLLYPIKIFPKNKN